MKTALTVFLAWGNLCLAANLAGQSVTNWLVFEPATLPRGSRAVSLYQEQGFQFAAFSGMAHSDNGVGTAAPSNGTPYLVVGNSSAPVFLNRLDMRPFRLVSADLGEYSMYTTNAGRQILFTGYRPDGSQVSQSFLLDGFIDAGGPGADFQPIVFSDDFTNLLYASISNAPFTLDNVVMEWSQEDPPPTQNFPPMVTLLTPKDGAVVLTITNLSMQAMGFDPDSRVSTIEFYVDSSLVAIATNTNPTNTVAILSAIWGHTQSGEHVFQAAVPDDQGNRIFSIPVRCRLAPSIEVPQVSLGVLDALAAETGPDDEPNAAVVLFQRNRNITNDLTVHFRLDGTASNGVDYATLVSPVVIPAGASNVALAIVPLDDALAEGLETVILQLVSPPTSQWPTYTTATSNRVTLELADDELKTNNLPPTVRLVSPPNGSSRNPTLRTLMQTAASDPDGVVRRVDFYEGNRYLGSATNNPGLVSASYYFSCYWSNSLPGAYLLSAVATDNEGAATQSSNILVYVQASTGTNYGNTNGVPVVNVYAYDSYASEGLVYVTTNTVYYTNNPQMTNGGYYTNNPGATNFVYTNTASFTIARSGPLTATLSVQYVMDGTASNGVDYVSLPGNLILSAGTSSKTLLVQPMDDDLVEPLETVRLTLVAPVPPNTNATPAYLLGASPRASVTIADNDLPRQPTRLADGQYLLSMAATNGESFLVEVSTDLRVWTPVCTNTVVDGALYFTDPEASDYRRRFYRVTPASY